LSCEKHLYPKKIKKKGVEKVKYVSDFEREGGNIILREKVVILLIVTYDLIFKKFS
jgi:hypothetical protein